jgi:hypothetical protein
LIVLLTVRDALGFILCGSWVTLTYRPWVYWDSALPLQRAGDNVGFEHPWEMAGTPSTSWLTSRASRDMKMGYATYLNTQALS